MGNIRKISKREWEARGGLTNPDLYRKERRGTWEYYEILD